MVNEISPVELARALEAGEKIQVLDVRAPERLATGRIDLLPEARFHNIRGSEVMTWHQASGSSLDEELPVAVVCERGNDSKRVAAHLAELGMAASSLHGGMAAWMRLVVPRELATPPALDRLVQLDRVGKGALGYLLASEGEALVVDPPRDSHAYLELAQEAGARVVGVADTHVHADYISGGSRLAGELAIPYYLHPADSIYPWDGTPGKLDYHPLEHGDTIPLGRGRISVYHTPGHTLGSLTYLIDDAVALTGDFIFVASIGRPDLGGKTDEWSEQLWESLERVRKEWSRDLWIYPGHYGSEDERSPDLWVGARFEDLPRQNAAFAITEQDAFLAYTTASEADYPEAYRQIKAINLGLLVVSDREADTLEVGKNECALGGR